ncbi:HNH endonuclease [Pseudoroseicyclus sp. H15]
MGRLKTLKPELRRAPARLGFLPRDVEERRTNPLRHLYKTARWQRLRWKVLTRDLFTCRRCHKLEADTSLLVADHVIPHRGDEALFWDEGNLQCLCTTCHDGAKQREEAAARRHR